MRLKASAVELDNGDVIINIKMKDSVEGLYGVNLSSCVFHILPDFDMGRYEKEFPAQKRKHIYDLKACFETLKILFAERKIKVLKVNNDAALFRKSIKAGVPIVSEIAVMTDEGIYESILERQKNREACKNVKEWVDILRVNERKLLEKIKKTKRLKGGGCLIKGYNLNTKEFLIFSTLTKDSFWISEKEYKALADGMYTVYFEL